MLAVQPDAVGGFAGPGARGHHIGSRTWPTHIVREMAAY